MQGLVRPEDHKSAAEKDCWAPDKSNAPARKPCSGATPVVQHAAIPASADDVHVTALEHGKAAVCTQHGSVLHGTSVFQVITTSNGSSACATGSAHASGMPTPTPQSVGAVLVSIDEMAIPCVGPKPVYTSSTPPHSACETTRQAVYNQLGTSDTMPCCTGQGGRGLLAWLLRHTGCLQANTTEHDSDTQQLGQQQSSRAGPHSSYSLMQQEHTPSPATMLSAIQPVNNDSQYSDGAACTGPDRSGVSKQQQATSAGSGAVGDLGTALHVISCTRPSADFMPRFRSLNGVPVTVREQEAESILPVDSGFECQDGVLGSCVVGQPHRVKAPGSADTVAAGGTHTPIPHTVPGAMRLMQRLVYWHPQYVTPANAPTQHSLKPTASLDSSTSAANIPAIPESGSTCVASISFALPRSTCEPTTQASGSALPRSFPDHRLVPALEVGPSNALGLVGAELEPASPAHSSSHNSSAMHSRASHCAAAGLTTRDSHSSRRSHASPLASGGGPEVGRPTLRFSLDRMPPPPATTPKLRSSVSIKKDMQFQLPAPVVHRLEHGRGCSAPPKAPPIGDVAPAEHCISSGSRSREYSKALSAASSAADDADVYVPTAEQPPARGLDEELTAGLLAKLMDVVKLSQIGEPILDSSDRAAMETLDVGVHTSMLAHTHDLLDSSSSPSGELRGAEGDALAMAAAAQGAASAAQGGEAGMRAGTQGRHAGTSTVNARTSARPSPFSFAQGMLMAQSSWRAKGGRSSSGREATGPASQGPPVFGNMAKCDAVLTNTLQQGDGPETGHTSSSQMIAAGDAGSDLMCPPPLLPPVRPSSQSTHRDWSATLQECRLHHSQPLTGALDHRTEQASSDHLGSWRSFTEAAARAAHASAPAPRTASVKRLLSIGPSSSCSSHVSTLAPAALPPPSPSLSRPQQPAAGLLWTFSTEGRRAADSWPAITSSMRNRSRDHLCPMAAVHVVEEDEDYDSNADGSVVATVLAQAAELAASVAAAAAAMCMDSSDEEMQEEAPLAAGNGQASSSTPGHAMTGEGDLRSPALTMGQDQSSRPTTSCDGLVHDQSVGAQAVVTSSVQRLSRQSSSDSQTVTSMHNRSSCSRDGAQGQCVAVGEGARLSPTHTASGSAWTDQRLGSAPWLGPVPPIPLQLPLQQHLPPGTTAGRGLLQSGIFSSSTRVSSSAASQFLEQVIEEGEELDISHISAPQITPSTPTREHPSSPHLSSQRQLSATDVSVHEVAHQLSSVPDFAAELGRVAPQLSPGHFDTSASEPLWQFVQPVSTRSVQLHKRSAPTSPTPGATAAAAAAAGSWWSSPFTATGVAAQLMQALAVPAPPASWSSLRQSHGQPTFLHHSHHGGNRYRSSSQISDGHTLLQAYTATSPSWYGSAAPQTHTPLPRLGTRLVADPDAGAVSVPATIGTSSGPLAGDWRHWRHTSSATSTSHQLHNHMNTHLATHTTRNVLVQADNLSSSSSSSSFSSQMLAPRLCKDGMQASPQITQVHGMLSYSLPGAHFEPSQRRTSPTALLLMGTPLAHRVLDSAAGGRVTEAGTPASAATPPVPAVRSRSFAGPHRLSISSNGSTDWQLCREAL